MSIWDEEAAIFGKSSSKKSKNPFGIKPIKLEGFGTKEQKKDSRRAFTGKQAKKALSERGAKATCDKCHKEFPINVLQNHHKKAHSKGGKTIQRNLMVLCPTCHVIIHQQETNSDKKRKTKDENPFGIKPIKWY